MTRNSPQGHLKGIVTLSRLEGVEEQVAAMSSVLAGLRVIPTLDLKDSRMSSEGSASHKP